MKKFLVTRTREDGFTLIELLVVVIIIAILAAIAVPVYIGIQNNAKKSGIASDVATTKLNLAAALTEDGSIASGTYTAQGKSGDATVQNSGVGGDETIVVTVAQDGKSYTVKGSSAKVDYSSTYDSTTAQQTSGAAAAGSGSTGGGGSAVPAGTVAYQSNFNGVDDGWVGGTDAYAYTHSTYLEIYVTGNGYGVAVANIHKTVTGLTAGTSYTVTAQVGRIYGGQVTGANVSVTGIGAGSNTAIPDGATYPVTYTFTATGTTAEINVNSIPGTNLQRDLAVYDVKVVSN